MMATLKRVVVENWMQRSVLRQSDVMAPPLFYLPISGHELRRTLPLCSWPAIRRRQPPCRPCPVS